MKAIIYCDPESPIGRASVQTLEIIVPKEYAMITTSVPRRELHSGEYGMIVDTTTIGKKPGETGTVDSFLRTMTLDPQPEVVRVYNPTTCVLDILKVVSQYANKNNTSQGGE
jgi:hypothetical protein